MQPADWSLDCSHSAVPWGQVSNEDNINKWNVKQSGRSDMQREWHTGTWHLSQMKETTTAMPPLSPLYEKKRMLWSWAQLRAQLNMNEYYSWRKCRGLIFREYLKFCVPPLFQSVFNLTKGIQCTELFPKSFDWYLYTLLQLWVILIYYIYI